MTKGSSYGKIKTMRLFMEEEKRKVPRSGTTTNIFLRKQDNIFAMIGGEVFEQGPRSDELFYKASSDSAGVYYLISDRIDDGIIVNFEGLYENLDGSERRFLTKKDILRECYPILDFMKNAKPIFKKCELSFEPDFSRCREIKVKMNKRYPVGKVFNLIAEDGQHVLVQRVEQGKINKSYKKGCKIELSNEEFIFLPIVYLYNNGKNKIWKEIENINVKGDKEDEVVKTTIKACRQFTSRLRSIFGREICNVNAEKELL